MRNDQYDYKVNRKSSVIIGYIKSMQAPFTTEEIINKVFKIKKDQPEYNEYYQSVESFLKAKSDLKNIQKGMWNYSSKSINRSTDISTPVKTEEVVHILNYIERVKGYMKLSQELSNQIRAKIRANGMLEVSYDDCTYEFNVNSDNDDRFLFGNGVMDFFADANPIPRSRDYLSNESKSDKNKST